MSLHLQVKKLEKKIKASRQVLTYKKKTRSMRILKQPPLGFNAILVRNKPEIAGSIPASVILSLFNNDLLAS